jgi:hypothetical protein
MKEAQTIEGAAAVISEQAPAQPSLLFFFSRRRRAPHAALTASSLRYCRAEPIIRPSGSCGSTSTGVPISSSGCMSRAYRRTSWSQTGRCVVASRIRPGVARSRDFSRRG